MKSDFADTIRTTYNLDEESYNVLTDSVKNKIGLYKKNPIVRSISKYFDERNTIRSVKSVLKRNKLPKAEYKKVLALVNDNITLNRRIERLDRMHNLFKYWHVAHLPFALVMLIIMIIHVGVTILFGYRWIF
jgi:hypothetical protein